MSASARAPCTRSRRSTRTTSRSRRVAGGIVDVPDARVEEDPDAAAGQRVIRRVRAGAARECVVSSVAIQPISVGAAVYRVDASVAIEIVETLAPAHYVVAVAVVEAIVAMVAEQCVVAVVPVDQVGASPP